MQALLRSTGFVLSALGWLLLVLAVALLGGLLWLHSRSSDPYVVRSNSMQPVFSAGDLTVATRVSPSSIEVGDIITFYQPRIGSLVTHRVVQRGTGESATWMTKGDANATADFEQVRAQDLRGQYWFSIRYAGFAAVALSSTTGRIAVLLTPVLLLALGALVSGLAKGSETRAFRPGMVATS